VMVRKQQRKQHVSGNKTAPLGHDVDTSTRNQNHTGVMKDEGSPTDKDGSQEIRAGVVKVKFQDNASLDKREASAGDSSPQFHLSMHRETHEQGTCAEVATQATDFNHHLEDQHDGHGRRTPKKLVAKASGGGAAAADEDNDDGRAFVHPRVGNTKKSASGKKKTTTKKKKATKTKKKKGGFNPEARVCANCSAPEILGALVYLVCGRCRVTWYCGRNCQKNHWKHGGHKVSCVTPAERSLVAVAAAAAAAQADKSMSAEGREVDEECAVCMEIMDPLSLCTLPCTHRFHVECLKKWRSFGNPTCPLCRDELPPGPGQLFAEACWFLCRIDRRVRRADGSWGNLTAGQQETMNEVVRLLGLAAEQGHVRAQ